MTDGIKEDRAPNAAFFALVYFGCLIAVMIMNLLVAVLLKFHLPSVLGFLVFYLAAWIAGQKYAESLGGTWTRPERRRLAIVYSAIAIVISLVVAGVVLAISEPDATAILTDLRFLVIMILVLPLGALIQYAMARFAFGQIVKKISGVGAE